jgi:hypothetical protein
MRHTIATTCTIALVVLAAVTGAQALTSDKSVYVIAGIDTEGEPSVLVGSGIV